MKDYLICDSHGLGCAENHPVPEPEPVPVAEVSMAASMNAAGSTTGRVQTQAGSTSVVAALKVNVTGHRGILMETFQKSENGLTSIEGAKLLPLTANDMVPNAHPRFNELWEMGLIAIWRESGQCKLGVCHPHDKPKTIHKPTLKCDIHGEAQQRDGASIWGLTYVVI